MGRELGTAGEHTVNGMNPFYREIDRLEEDAKPYARKAMVRARRFFAIFFPAFFTAVLTANNLTWGTLWSLVFSVAVAALAEIDPSIPWSTFVQLLDRARWLDPVDAPKSNPIPPRRPS